MTIYVNQNGTWLEVEQPHVYDVSIWKKVKNQYVNQSGTWRTVFPDFGGLFMWGNSITSSVGSDTQTSTYYNNPRTTFAGGIEWKKINAGANFSGAIDIDGYLWTWANSTTTTPSAFVGRHLVTRTLTPITTFAGGTDWNYSNTTPDDLYKISIYDTSAYAIKTDGTLWVWGSARKSGLHLGSGGADRYNYETPITTFAGGTNWRTISSGFQYVSNTKDATYVAVKTDGTLWMWGNYIFPIANFQNQILGRTTPVTTFIGGTDWKSAQYHAGNYMALKTDGTLWTWGNTDLGTLGRPWYEGKVTPVTVFGGGTNWKYAPDDDGQFTIHAGGSMHGGAIKTDGTLWVWGTNASSVLGLGSGLAAGFAVHTPVTTRAGGTNWKNISSGYNFTAAIKTDGTLWMWGNDWRGILGIGSPGNGISRPQPVTTFAGGTNWKQVSCSFTGSSFTSASALYTATAAVKTDGTLWTWGDNSSGRLGLGFLGSTISTPVTTFAGGTNWRQVSCSNQTTAAIKTDGTLWVWGVGSTNFTMGVASGFGRSTPTTTFAGGTNWKQVDCGYLHMAAIKTDGTLWTWGRSDKGEFGNNISTQIVSSTPITTFAGGTNWKQVSCGYQSTMAIKTDGTLWVWGNASLGLMGDGTFSDPGGASSPGLVYSIPTKIGTATNWAQVVATRSRQSTEARLFRKVVATKTDGTLWVWGLWGRSSAGSDFFSYEANFRGSSLPLNAGPANGYDGMPKSLVPEALPGTWTDYGINTGVAMGIKTDGTLWTWGNNNGAILLHAAAGSRWTPVTTSVGGTNWKQISVFNTTRAITGYGRAAAIKTDGTLWLWGNSTFGGGHGDGAVFAVNPSTTVLGGTDWKSVTCGFHGTAAIKTDGTLWIWGNNAAQTLGINSTLTSLVISTPVTTFAGGNNWSQVRFGFENVIATKTDGTLWVWGNNNNSQLAVRSVLGTEYPSRIDDNPEWEDISSGTGHAAAVKTDGTLWTWGANIDGGLGNRSTIVGSTPVTTFAGGTNWKQVSCGYKNTFAIKTDGTLWAWGNGILGTLGNNNQSQNIDTPVTVFGGGTDWKQVSTNGYSGQGNSRTAAVKTDGTLWIWGRYEPPSGVSSNFVAPFTTFVGGTNWKQVSCGPKMRAAVKTDGTLWTWGKSYSNPAFYNLNLLGRLSQYTFRATPSTIFGGGTNWANPATTNPEDLSIISCSSTHSAAIKTDGTLWLWGNNSLGELGNTTGPAGRRSTPIQVYLGGTDWKQIVVGNNSTSHGIKTDGTLWVWGNLVGFIRGNPPFPATNGKPETTFIGGTDWKQVDCESYRLASAVKTDGTLWTWGIGVGLGNGQLGTTGVTPITTFAGGTNWKQVSSGYNFTAAIKTDGTLWMWGNATVTGLPINTSTPVTTFAGGTNWRQVSCSTSGTFGASIAAIKTDGTLWIWGSNYNGQIGNNTNVSISTPVTTFAGGTDWKQVSCSNSSTAAIKTDGTLWVWGNRTLGNLGNFDYASIASALYRPWNDLSLTPITTFAGGTDWAQVDCSTHTTIAVKQSGELYMWGNSNDRSLMTVINDMNAHIPEKVEGENWKSVSCGINHVSAVKTDGTLWVWGKMTNGLLGNNVLNTTAYYADVPITTSSGGTRWAEVSASQNHTLAIKKIDV